MFSLRLGVIWMALPAALVVFTAWTMTDFPLDYWLHVLNGRWIEQHGGLLQADIFTHTIDGREVLNFPWLAQWSMFRAHQVGGYSGAQLLAGLMYGAAIALTTWTAYRRCRDARFAAALGAIAAAVASTSLAVRPQAISVLLFAAALCFLFTWRPGWRLLVALAAIEIVWTNTHGGFPLGVALPGAFLTAALIERSRRTSLREALAEPSVRWLFAIVVVCGLAMFCNPFGLSTINYVFGVSSTASERMIGEWKPTSWEMLTGKALIVSLVVVLVSALGSRRRLHLVELLLMAPLLIVAFKSQRMAIWWALAMAPAIAPHLRSTIRQWFGKPAKDAPSVLNGIAAVFLALFVLGSTPFTRTHNPLLPEAKRARSCGEPNAAVDFLARAEAGNGRLFQPLEWGCYLSWKLHPDWSVFVDTRIEAFPDDVWSDYLSAAFQGRLDILEKYQIRWVVWDHTRPEQFLVEQLSASDDWREVHRDSLSVVFQRVRLPSGSDPRPQLSSNR